MTDEVRSALLATGCAAAGFCFAGRIDERVDASFRRWLSAGNSAGMEYLGRHAELRLLPESVMPGVHTVISVAFRFPKPTKSLPIAAYALGRNYHKAINSALRPFVDALRRHGATVRVAVDSAPVAERYWALKAGIATRGHNGMALVSGCGPYAFLCEVLTDIDLTAESAYLPYGKPPVCTGCFRCVRACPGRALDADGFVDARRCLSYLSIEHRGTIPANLASDSFPLLGCDCCLSVCPLGDEACAPVIADLMPRPEIEALTSEQVLSMSDDELEALTAGTSLRRPGMENLRRNARMNLSARKIRSKERGDNNFCSSSGFSEEKVVTLQSDYELP